MSLPIDSLSGLHQILATKGLQHRSLDRISPSANATRLPGGMSVNYDEKGEKLTAVSYESGFKVVVNESSDGQRIVVVQNPHGNYLISSNSGYWYVLD